MLNLVVPAILLLISSPVRGRPDGGHTNACLTLIPEHSYIEAQKTPFPYVFYLDETRPYIDHKVVLTIMSKSNDTKIAGFMVQARELEFISNPFGTFIAQGPVQVMNCLAGINNTATHTEPSPKDLVSMVWYPPAGYKGQFRFYATVAKNREEFWVASPSHIVEYREVPV